MMAAEPWYPIPVSRQVFLCRKKKEEKWKNKAEQ